MLSHHITHAHALVACSRRALQLEPPRLPRLSSLSIMGSYAPSPGSNYVPTKFNRLSDDDTDRNSRSSAHFPSRISGTIAARASAWNPHTGDNYQDGNSHETAKKRRRTSLNNYIESQNSTSSHPLANLTVPTPLPLGAAQRSMLGALIGALDNLPAAGLSRLLTTNHQRPSSHILLPPHRKV